MASFKTHIQRVEASTRGGAIVRSLCGLSNNHMAPPHETTCDRCIKIYANTHSMKATLEERIKEVTRKPRVRDARIKITPEDRQAIREGILNVVDNQAALSGKLEVRTTSSTGGQKGVKAQRFDLIPAGPLMELAELYGYGAAKYDVHQWRQGYEWEKSFAAIQRHSWAWQAGFDYDVCSNDPGGCQHVDSKGEPFETGRPDTCYNHTGAHHMTAVAWHAFGLLEFKDTHPGHDDRYKTDLLAGFDPDRNQIAIKE